jgi:hypothetical protein
MGVVVRDVLGVAVLMVAGGVAGCDPPRASAPAETPVAVAHAAPPAPDAAMDAAVDAPPGAELLVTALTPRPGTSAIVTWEAALDYDLNLGGFATITSTTQSKKKKVAITAVDPDGTVHKLITYIKRDTNMVVDGERKKDPSPIRGKTFRVTWKDGVIDVRRRNGAPATPEEVEAVRQDEGQLQSPELLGKVLSGLRLVEGQPFEVPFAMLEKLVDGDFRVRRMVLTYLGKTDEGARIDAEGALVMEAALMKTFVDIKTELVVDDTGWCRSANAGLQARVEFLGTVVGSGGGKGTIRATPLR